MAEQGKVFEVKNGLAKVTMQRHEACKDCHACDIGKSEEMILNAKPLCDVKVGDNVEIFLENKDFLKATFIMYGIPLITLVAGFIVGYYGGEFLGFNGDLIGFVLGIALVGITYSWIKSKEEKWKKGNYQPVITKVLSREEK